MAPTQEDTAINRLIKKHLLNEPALLNAAAILGVHPAGDATPETVKAILPQRDIPWKQLLYGTPLQRKMAVESLKTHYGFKALEMLEKAHSLNTASPEQISSARMSVSGSIEAAFTTITKATRPPKKEKTHRQPRELLKTLASNIGKGPDLFSVATFLDSDIPILKDTLSKSAAILALELMKDMQAKGTTRGEYGAGD